MRQAGRGQAEFEKALAIDPPSFIAQQELQRTLQMIKEGGPASPGLNARDVGTAAAAGQAQGPVELAPISSAPITLKMTEKTNVIYETVGNWPASMSCSIPTTRRSRSASS